MKKPLELTRGLLDTTTVLDDRVRLGGWVAALDPLRVEGFRAEIGGQPREIFALRKGMDSPDIAQHFPHLFEPGRCRFFLDLVRKPDEEISDTLACVTPLLSSGHPGCVLPAPIARTVPAPPEAEVDSVGGGVYGGLEFLAYFVSLAGLRPRHDVLDIGCGVGRMALPLAYFLDHRARYFGFDIVEHGIQWASDHITANFPNFEFRRLDIYNEMYNPAGTMQAVALEFPTDSASFDFVFLTSVFTHMQGPEVRRYLDEIARVLREDGRCLLTCFLIDTESRSLMEAGVSNHEFEHQGDDCYIENPDVPEAAVGFEDQRLIGWLRERGLAMTSRFNGTWCGRRGLSYQDILVVHKTR
ncbi:MAG: class I SAM-dependent methyltransferase [Planctomycetota bacterium]